MVNGFGEAIPVHRSGVTCWSVITPNRRTHSTMADGDPDPAQHVQVVERGLTVT